MSVFWIMNNAPKTKKERRIHIDCQKKYSKYVFLFRLCNLNTKRLIKDDNQSDTWYNGIFLNVMLNCLCTIISSNGNFYHTQTFLLIFISEMKSGNGYHTCIFGSVVTLFSLTTLILGILCKILTTPFMDTTVIWISNAKIFTYNGFLAFYEQNVIEYDDTIYSC